MNQPTPEHEPWISNTPLQPSAPAAAASRSVGHCSETTFFLLLVAFTLQWTAFTLFFDYIMYARDAVQQARTGRFVQTNGKIVKCTAKTDDSSPPIDIRYSYQIAGKEHFGDRIRFSLSAYPPVAEMIATHPPGKQIVVFYDANDPATVVLQKGIDGREILTPLCLLPFNVMMLGLCRLVFVGICHRGKGWYKLHTGLRLIDGDEESRLGIPGREPFTWALGALAIAPIPVYIFFQLATDPTDLKGACSAWIIVLVIAALVYVRCARRVSSGRYDVVINHLDKTLTVPETFANEPIQVELRNLIDIELVSETNTEGD